METKAKGKIKGRLSGLFLSEGRPFTKKRDLNWKLIKKTGIIGVIVAVIVLLLLPSPKKSEVGFKGDTSGSGSNVTSGTDPTSETLSEIQQAPINMRSVHDSLGYLYQGSGTGAGGSQVQANSMIVRRDPQDTRNQTPQGTRFPVQLFERVILSTQAMPVVALVMKDVLVGSEVAIPQGSKLYGDGSLDDSSDRVQVSFNSLEFPDRQRVPITAIGMSLDGQPGIEGNIHSNALKNAVGETLGQFIGAFAEGSMAQGMLGASPGGIENGLKNAIAETAKNRTQAMADNMRKEKTWAELGQGLDFMAMLTQPFSVSPGASNVQ